MRPSHKISASPVMRTVMRLLGACPNGQTRPGQLLSSARLLQPDLGETAEQGIFFDVSSIRYRSRPPIIAFGGPRSDVPLAHGWLLPGFSPPLHHRPSGFLPTVGASLLVDLYTLSGLRVVGLCVGPLWGRWLAAGGDPMPLCPWERRALRGSCLGSCLREG